MTAADARYAAVSHSHDYAATGHTHTGVYQPVGNYALVSQLPDISGKANTTDVTTALAGKSNVGHTHAEYAPSTGSTVYATKAEVTQATGGGLTQMAADSLYAPISGSTVYATVAQIPDISGKANTTDVTVALLNKVDQAVYDSYVASTATAKADVTYVDTQLAAKVNMSDYMAYALTNSEIIAGKVNVEELTTGLAAKADVTHTHSEYQTKANMVTEGSETTYYSGAKVDALLASIPTGGASSFLHLTSPNKATYNPEINMGWGFFCWQVRENTTPFTLFGGPRVEPNPAWPTQFSVNVGDMVPNLHNIIQNRTSDSFRIRTSWQLGSTAMLNVASGLNLAYTWVQHLKNVPVDNTILHRINQSQMDPAQHNSDYASFSFDSVTSVSGTPAGTIPNFPSESVRAYGMVDTRHLRPYHTASAIFTFGPGDVLVMRTGFFSGTTSTGVFDHLFFDHNDTTNRVIRMKDGYINEWMIEATKL